MVDDIERNNGKDMQDAYEQAAEGEEVQVYDGLPLIEEATALKVKANDCVKRKELNEAVKLYDEGIAILRKCQGYPMLADERAQVDELAAVLHCNTAQCMLNLQLYRRAIESASACLGLDASNVKALHRRSQAYEAVRDYEPALRDAIELQKLGGGALGPDAAEKRCNMLFEKHADINKKTTEFAKDNEDQLNMLSMKERFDEVVDKYDLQDTDFAPEVTNWLVRDKDMPVTVRKIVKRWQTTTEDAEALAKWISKGLDMKIIPNPLDK